LQTEVAQQVGQHVNEESNMLFKHISIRDYVHLLECDEEDNLRIDNEIVTVLVESDHLDVVGVHIFPPKNKLFTFRQGLLSCFGKKVQAWNEHICNTTDEVKKISKGLNRNKTSLKRYGEQALGSYFVGRGEDGKFYSASQHIPISLTLPKEIINECLKVIQSFENSLLKWSLLESEISVGGASPNTGCSPFYDIFTATYAISGFGVDELECAEVQKAIFEICHKSPENLKIKFTKDDSENKEILQKVFNNLNKITYADWQEKEVANIDRKLSFVKELRDKLDKGFLNEFLACFTHKDNISVHFPVIYPFMNHEKSIELCIETLKLFCYFKFPQMFESLFIRSVIKGEIIGEFENTCAFDDLLWGLRNHQDAFQEVLNIGKGYIENINNIYPELWNKNKMISFKNSPPYVEFLNVLHDRKMMRRFYSGTQATMDFVNKHEDILKTYG
jgi:hypothetical protein